MEQKNTRNQYLAVITLSLSSLCFGLLTGWLPPVLPLLASEDTPLDEPLLIKDSSWIVSLQYIGKFIATFVFGYLINIIGRKWCACIPLLPLIASSLFIVFGRNTNHITISRFLLGVGGGGFLTTDAVYITEIADVSIRGKLSSILPVNVFMGITLGIIIGSFVPYYASGYLLTFITTLSFILAVIILPESPIFLLQKGKKKAAEEINLWLNGAKDKGHRLELQTLNAEEDNMLPEESRVRYKELISRVTLKGIFIGVLIFVFQQGSGYFGVVLYSSIIFRETGSFLSPNISTIIMSLVKNSATIFSNLLIEKTGRRKLLMISSITTGISLLIIGTYLYLKHIETDMSSFNWVPLLILSVYGFVYSIGLGVIPYVIISELFSSRIKPTAASICMFSYELAAFTVCKTYISLVMAFGWHGCFWFFCCFTFVGTVFIYFFVPETKGRTSETIVDELRDKKMCCSCLL